MPTEPFLTVYYFLSKEDDMDIKLSDLVNSNVRIIDNGKELPITEFALVKTEHTKNEISLQVKIGDGKGWYTLKSNGVDDIVQIIIEPKE